MRVIIPEFIFDAIKKFEKYILPDGSIDPNAPEEVKKAYETCKKWENKYDNFM